MPESRRRKLVTQNEMSMKSTVLPLAHAALTQKKRTNLVEAKSRQGSHGRAAAAYTHVTGEGLR